MQKISTLSFKEIKQRISLEQVLRHYNLFDGLQLRGKSHRGSCPFCEAANGNPFSVSLEKNCYQCFTCNASGNILDFVSKWEGVSIREAGQILIKNCVGELEPQIVPQPEEKTTEREVSPVKETSPPIPVSPVGGSEGEDRADEASGAQVTTAGESQSETPSRNEPLTFALKNIEPDHLSVKALGIHEDILTAFGIGYYRGRGMMEHRIVIPVFNTSRQLVAYAGFHPEEHTYTYPPKFRRELELYNLGGALADMEADQGLILVRHPLEVITLVSAGHLNAAAIMGDTLSSEQKEMLLAEYSTGERVTLLWPIQVDVVPTLSELLPDFFVRLRRYEEKAGTPFGFTVEDVRELLV